MNKLIVEKHMTMDLVYNTEESLINNWIAAINFHNKKAHYIKMTTKDIVEKHKGIVPSNIKDILAFPGVGYKMAHLLLQNRFDKIEGISVDTHVHRISNRLKWVSSKTPD
jgi:endonuclease-3